MAGRRVSETMLPDVIDVYQSANPKPHIVVSGKLIRIVVQKYIQKRAHDVYRELHNTDRKPHKLMTNYI